jgi:hypothetical protein
MFVDEVVSLQLEALFLEERDQPRLTVAQLKAIEHGRIPSGSLNSIWISRTSGPTFIVWSCYPKIMIDSGEAFQPTSSSSSVQTTSPMPGT